MKLGDKIKLFVHYDTRAEGEDVRLALQELEELIKAKKERDELREENKELSKILLMDMPLDKLMEFDKKRSVDRKHLESRVQELEEENQIIDDIFKIIKDNAIELPLDCYHEETGQYTHTVYREIECIDDLIDWVQYAVNHDFENDFNENERYIKLGKALEYASNKGREIVCYDKNNIYAINEKGYPIKLIDWYESEVTNE